MSRSCTRCTIFVAEIRTKLILLTRDGQGGEVVGAGTYHLDTKRILAILKQ